MSYADEVFVQNAKDIIEHGTDTKGQKVRPVWEDGTPAYTIKRFGVCNRYDLRKEFPVITLRKTAIKSAFDEILWIFQKKSNNIHDLNSHIWDEWADEKGSIGKAYGYQIGDLFIYKKVIEIMDRTEYIQSGYNFDDNITPKLKALKEEAKTIDGAVFDWFLTIQPDDKYKIQGIIYIDQIDMVIHELKTQPFSRRILTSIWNFQDLNQMNLQPCCWSCTFNVTDEGGDKLVLNMVLNQRSNDFLAANNWNVVQYALLQMMLAQVCNMEAGEMVHMIADQHIYDRHVPLVEELITREQYPAPKVTLNPDIHDFYEFTVDDLKIEDYQYGPQIKNIPIAV